MTSPVQSGTSIVSATTSLPTAKTQELDKDAFLKLLVAQLKYQDPNKPADATSFMAQTAQFTQVEKLADIDSGQQQLLGMQVASTAAGMVGRTVAYTAADGTKGTGPVTAAAVSGNSYVLRVDGKHVPLTAVTEIRATA